MPAGPQVELTIGYQQIQDHPLFKAKWSEASMKLINTEMTALFVKILNKMQREIPPTIPKGATGNLKKSYRAEPIRGRGIELTGIWGTGISYAAWHEWGTGKHFPPVNALIPWVVTKGFTYQKKTTGGHFINMQVHEGSPEYVKRGMAFIIARVISRRGTIPGNEREDWLKDNEVKTTKRIAAKMDELFEKISVNERQNGF